MKVVLPDGSIGDRDGVPHTHICSTCPQEFTCICFHPLRRRECSECFVRALKSMLDALEQRLFPTLSKHAKEEKI